MPQMCPLWWFILSIFFIFSFLYLFCLIYFIGCSLVFYRLNFSLNHFFWLW
uniref:ATP synthase F0 subunit 8 n=1 Tax=Petalocephala ochracea TaxID=2038650 RepID=A0A343K822_9HEMI|nr:ATP synthase F0 subunit 8 [Petalocephala ochracea]